MLWHKWVSSHLQSDSYIGLAQDWILQIKLLLLSVVPEEYHAVDIDVFHANITHNFRLIKE